MLFAPEYRDRFQPITEEMHDRCPIAWTDTYDGHWVAAGNREVFELARCPHLSNDNDPEGVRRGYRGISIPASQRPHETRAGILEMDEPEHRALRSVLNPYLSPAAVRRWIPFIDEVIRASLDEKIESGRIDFVDDLANIVPAVLTLAMLGIPLHGRPLPDSDVLGMLALIIGGGFDTTTALTAHALEWLSEHPGERETLSRERTLLLDSATEEFLRYYTPAPGDGRTIAADCEVAGVEFREGDRLWLSWAMANRDPAVFENPTELILDRKHNRHYSFGLGIHRCIGSNVARTVFKRMLVAVLDRMPDYRCLPGETVHYETIAVIQGMRQLPAEFTPGPRLGPGLDETLERLQRVCDEQRLAEPITVQRDVAEI